MDKWIVTKTETYEVEAESRLAAENYLQFLELNGKLPKAKTKNYIANLKREK